MTIQVLSDSTHNRTPGNGSCCDYKSMKLFGMALTLAYLMFLAGGGEMNLLQGSETNHEGAQIANVVDNHDGSSLRKNSNAVKKKERQFSTPLDDSKSEDKSRLKKKNNGIEKIVLLGERHSGTNWITDHLVDCFQEDIPVTNEYHRFKHWFQQENPDKIAPNSALVITMFRDPYDWVEAMRERPHHAHDHMGLDWRSFVTKPWVGHRGTKDKEMEHNLGSRGIRENGRGGTKDICLDFYSFKEIIPCSEEDSPTLPGYGMYKYELNHDGSEKPYSSIVDLRKQKIINHLSVKGFEGTKKFLPYRYEDLNFNGTQKLLDQIEDITGLKAKCQAVNGTGIVKHKEVPKEYVKWMNQYVDWGVERQIGYERRTLN